MPSAHPPTVDATTERAYAKISRRLVSFLFAMFVLAFLDRVNVGYAKLQFASDLGFSNTVYGIGAGIFFLGYFLFEVPSNILFQKLGARATMCRIMILWGLISCAMMFIRSEAMFYVLRFALGAAEAGFFPGVILYLTYWYPDRRRAKATALFYLAVPVAGILGAPLSGWLLSASHGLGGLRGWQWMFLLEGLPTVAVGIAAWWILHDKPADAPWLTEEEKRRVTAEVAESRAKADAGLRQHGLGPVLRSAPFWTYTAIYFSIVIASSSFTFWMPQIIADLGFRDPVVNGQIITIPYLTAGIGMFLMARSSERKNERVRHFALASLGAATLLTAMVVLQAGAVPTIALLSVAYAGVLSCIVLFWPMPSARLPGAAVAVGLAAINSIGNLAGYFSGWVMGALRDRYGNTGMGLLLVAASLCLAGMLVMLADRRTRSRDVVVRGHEAIRETT